MSPRQPGPEVIVTLFLLVAVVAVLVSMLRGGRPVNLLASGLRWTPAPIVGLGLQVLAHLRAGSAAVGDPMVAMLYVLSGALLAAFCVVNWYRHGMALVGLGFGLNLLVVLANSGMPVAVEAIMAVGGDPRAPLRGSYHLLTSATALPLLADLIPVPPLRLVVSVGDVLLLVGLVPLVHDLMTAADIPTRLGRRLP